MQHSKDLIDLLETISPATLAIVIAEIDAETKQHGADPRRISGYHAALRTLQINAGELEAAQMIDDAEAALRRPTQTETITRRRHEYEMKQIEDAAARRVSDAEAGRSQTIQRHRKEINAARVTIENQRREIVRLSEELDALNLYHTVKMKEADHRQQWEIEQKDREIKRAAAAIVRREDTIAAIEAARYAKI